jgi:hypothetical protein
MSPSEGKHSQDILNLTTCLSNYLAKRLTRRVQIPESDDGNSAEKVAALSQRRRDKAKARFIEISRGSSAPSQNCENGEGGEVETSGEDPDSSSDEESVKPNDETNKVVCLAFVRFPWMLTRLRPETRPNKGPSPLW